MDKVSEKAVSKQQQRLMGIVHALQKGDMKSSKASGKAKEMAKSMKPSDVTKFAATKHKGLPKKVKKENMGVASMYLVRRPNGKLAETDLVMELNPLEGIQPLNIMQDDVHSVHHDETEAQRIAAEAYKSYCDEALQLEEKKGKVGDKLKKAIDKLEKKRKEHVNMVKEDPKNASKHKEEIAKIASQIDDLMVKLERVEKSKKEREKEEKEDLKEASNLQKIMRKLTWDDWSPKKYANQIKGLSDETLKSWYEDSKKNKAIPNTPLAYQHKLVNIEMQKRGLLEKELEKKKKAISEARFGIYISNFDLSVIAKSLKQTKLISDDEISVIEDKKDEYAINDIIIKNASKIIQSLRKNGKKYLHEMYLDKLINNIRSLETGEYDFIDLKL